MERLNPAQILPIMLAMAQPMDYYLNELPTFRQRNRSNKPSGVMKAKRAAQKRKNRKNK